jgi:hypothetical protein
MEHMHARFKRTHHTSRGLVEHLIGNMIKQMTLELKVDDEVNVSLVSNWRERPCVYQMLPRTFGGTHEHLSRPIQRDLARGAFLEWTEPDDEVGDYLSLVLAMYTRAAALWHEQGIILHVRHDRRKFVGAIGERNLFLVTRHVTPPSYTRRHQRALRRAQTERRCDNPPLHRPPISPTHWKLCVKVSAGRAVEAVREGLHAAFRSTDLRYVDPIETASILSQSINGGAASNDSSSRPIHRIICQGSVTGIKTANRSY